MKLSIIIPVYNAEKLLDRLLQSVVNQNVSNSGGYEVLAINDGSTDGSLSILYKWQEKHPQLIKVFTKPNSGVSSTRNFGIEKATGEWIAFCDSDDYVAEFSFGRLLESVMAEDRNDIGLVRYAIKHVNQEEPIPDGVSYNRLYLLDKATFFKEHLYWGCWHFLYKRDLLVKSGIRFRSIPVSEDGLFNVEYLLQKSNFSVLGFDSAIYRYYSNPNSVCNSFNPNSASIYVEAYCQYFSILRDIATRDDLSVGEKDRLSWISAKALPNILYRMKQSNLSYTQLRQQCRRVIEIGVIPCCIKTRQYGIIEFLIKRPLFLFFYGSIYKAAKRILQRIHK